ncbi:hypothetical protein D3C81_2093410 [compost metagenome]
MATHHPDQFGNFIRFPVGIEAEMSGMNAYKGDRRNPVDESMKGMKHRAIAADRYDDIRRFGIQLQSLLGRHFMEGFA